MHGFFCNWGKLALQHTYIQNVLIAGLADTVTLHI